MKVIKEYIKDKMVIINVRIVRIVCKVVVVFDEMKIYEFVYIWIVLLLFLMNLLMKKFCFILGMNIFKWLLLNLYLFEFSFIWEYINSLLMLKVWKFL